ncbi:MAG: alpha/beta hydrolase [Bacteroidota bacterium]|nr:MAG: alpha/beta hydrolase [Bacteroidota bacterium]
MSLVTLWWFNSSGKADPITGKNGKTIPNSISAIDTIRLGGMKQYLIIRGADSSKPVMLFVHGGPGGPEIGMMKETNQLIENDFVMVYWEQRGAGKSYNPYVPPKSMNLEQFILDAGELSQYLTKRFKKDKIYIMGHSWGSLLGILTANRYPELFHAYFGVGQIGHQYKGELVSFEWVKNQAQLQNDKAGINDLANLNFPNHSESYADLDEFNAAWDAFIGIERNYVMKYGGGAMREMRGILPLVRMIFLAHEYTIEEKFNYLKGSDFSAKYLWKEVIDTNLFNEIDSMQVPVYILQGLYDYQTPYPVAKVFFDQLKAPEKKFFTFEKSAHSPIFEEVEKFNQIVREHARDN